MAHPTTPPPPAGIKNDITIHAPPPIKAKTPVIVLHQGKSRQTLKYKDAILPSALRSGTANLRIGRAGAAAPPHPNEDAPPVTVSADPYRTSLTRKSPIKAKTQAIKANRASSRQTPFFQTTPSSWRIKPLDWANRQTEDQCVCQGKILSLGRGNRCGRASH